jgi:hypothetical protein
VVLTRGLGKVSSHKEDKVKLVLVTLCAVGLAVSVALSLAHLRAKPGPDAALALPTSEAKPPLGDQGLVVTLEDVSPPRGEVAESTDVSKRVDESKDHKNDQRALEEKYAGASLGQLMEAEWVFAEKYNRERDRIAKELVANNRLTTVAAGESTGPKTTASHPTMSFVTVLGSDVNGTPVTQGARIGGDEYPEFEALELEVGWLRNRVFKLKRDRSPAPK